MGFGLFSLVGGFVLFYSYQRLRKRKELEKIRATIAADFHDELGSTLSSIALSSEMALYSHGEADKQLKTVLSQISESSRNTVLAMKDMIWTIEPANDNLQEMIFRMKAYAFPLAEVKNMQLNLQVNERLKA
jgi:signal transduction histidine kinase